MILSNTLDILDNGLYSSNCNFVLQTYINWEYDVCYPVCRYLAILYAQIDSEGVHK